MNVRDPARLYMPQPPWIYRLSGTESEVTDFSWSLDATKVVARTLRGKKMTTSQYAFDEIAAALQFPYYFGENWDALEECINDLSWLPGGGYVLFVMDAATLLAIEGPGQMETFLNVMGRAGQEWSKPISLGEWWDRPSRPFHVVLHTSGNEAYFQDRMTALGYSIPEL